MNGATPDTLFAPVKLGALNLAHRLVLSTDHGLPVAAASMSPMAVFGDYYESRAIPGGLVICGTPQSAQATSPGTGLLPRTTKLVNEWRLVTDLIRSTHGQSVLQLAHPQALLTTPLCLGDLDEALDEYRMLADNAGDAGFDGVEVTCLTSLGSTAISGSRSEADEAALHQFFLEALSSITSIWPAQRVGLCCADTAVTDEAPSAIFDSVLGHCSAFLRVTPSDPSRVAAVAADRRQLLRSRGVGLVSCGPWSAMEASRAVLAGETECVAPNDFASHLALYEEWSRSRGA